MSDLKLIDAVKANDYAEAEALIKGGADVNQQDEQGWTPLNFAAGKGDLAMCKLLVENGADIFKVGRDQRTPYLIALAAGRVSVVKYLKEAEGNYPGEKPLSPQRKYCKAYLLGELRKYPAWREGRINWKEKANGNGGPDEAPFPDDKIVFIQQDFTVTESMWHNENVIFNQVDPDWEEFCANTLKFKVPDDLDLIVSNENTN
ncbi:MAG TPA: ankyrin repeat domain-containing protein [Blastocatellia bacterium]|nr:ankyrin repeat domain-containing protein [Blastocatellia bacterium]